MAAQVIRRCHHRCMGKGKRNKAKRALVKKGQKSRQRGFINEVSAQIPRPNVTTFTNVIVVPRFPPDHPLGGVNLSPKGSAGNYTVDVVLGVPGISPSAFTNIDWDRIRSAGDSLLEVPGATSLTQEWQVGGPDGPRIISYEFRLNDMRRLSTGSTRLFAAGFPDALAAAFEVLESYLSSLSFQYDIPAEAIAWRVTEEETGAVQFAMKHLGKIKRIEPGTTLLTTPGTRELLATWRESMNAATPMGQALGFYKIIERVHHYRVEREVQTRGTDRHYVSPRERMPANIQEVEADYEAASKAFTAYLGMKFTKVWKEDLRDRIRNAVAHLREDAPSLTPDRSADVETCREAVPVLHYIARTMLRAEIPDQTNWPGMYTEAQ